MAELTLPQRLREAADVLQELSANTGHPWPEHPAWSPLELRREADVIEAEVPE